MQAMTPRRLTAEHEVPVPLVGLEEEGHAVAAGVVDEHVDRADAGDDLAHGRRVAHVEAHGVAADLGRHLLGAHLVEVGDRHVHAVGRQPPGGGGADAGRAAGDEGDRRDVIAASRR